MAFFLPALTALAKGAAFVGTNIAKGAAVLGKGMGAGFKTAFLPHLKGLPPGVLGPKQMVGGVVSGALKNPFLQQVLFSGAQTALSQALQPQEQQTPWLPMPTRPQWSIDGWGGGSSFVDPRVYGDYALWEKVTRAGGLF